ncbi:MAG: CpsD/CapB family tyrosine-protein kinase [Oscillospiraceae bacterium]|nr:CpsD/CapB family tyrosine-protein kinase [Oscillospiraceae bacterium]
MLQKKKDSVSTVFNANSRQKILNENTPFAIREAYRYFRTKLIFTGKGEQCPVFAFTSANAGDGKTITTINTAISFSELNKRTLIIDADMRNPSIGRYFSVKKKSGLSEYLAGIDESAALSETGIQNLTVLTAGAVPPNPAELLASQKLQTLIERARTEFDCVFIDTPPAGIVADALSLAQYCTGYVVVVQNGATRLTELQAVLRDIAQLGGDVCGVLMNDALGKGTGIRYTKSYRRRSDSYYHADPYGDGAKT